MKAILVTACGCSRMLDIPETPPPYIIAPMLENMQWYLSPPLAEHIPPTFKQRYFDFKHLDHGYAGKIAVYTERSER